MQSLSHKVSKTYVSISFWGSPIFIYFQFGSQLDKANAILMIVIKIK